MITDTDRLDFIINNSLRIENWNRLPDLNIYQLIDDENEIVGESTEARIAIDQAIRDKSRFEHLEA